MCSAAIIPFAMQAVGGIASGVAADDESKHTQKVAEYNAAAMENDAIRIREAGTEAENDFRAKVSALVANQRATLAAGNVDIGSGTALRVQEDALIMGEIDAGRIRTSAQREADALDEQARLTRIDGKLARQAGKLAKTSAGLMGAATVANGVASTWYTSKSAAMQ
jgi:hypothetical protein